MLTLSISKIDYSEWVIRKSLYWCSPEGDWTLTSVDNMWIINVHNPSHGFEFTLHRHLNDFLLRERLDLKTGNLREAIIKTSLSAVLLQGKQ
jgi:His-Xaa-Ser system protein HxsD